MPTPLYQLLTSSVNHGVHLGCLQGIKIPQFKQFPHTRLGSNDSLVNNFGAGFPKYGAQINCPERKS
jgi:hypothetical protein